MIFNWTESQRTGHGQQSKCLWTSNSWNVSDMRWYYYSLELKDWYINEMEIYCLFAEK